VSGPERGRRKAQGKMRAKRMTEVIWGREYRARKGTVQTVGPKSTRSTSLPAVGDRLRGLGHTWSRIGKVR